MINIKKMLISTLLIFISIISIWAGTISIDYVRAIDQKDPLFSIRQDYATDGGTIRYIGLGYVVTHYNQLLENGGRTDIEFSFSMEKEIISRTILSFFYPFVSSLFRGLEMFFCVVMPPIVIGFLLHKFKPKLLFLTPILAIIALILIGCLLWGSPNFELLSSIEAWFEFIIALIYFIAVTIIFYIVGKVRKGKNPKSNCHII